jgi:hypothetical protein
MPVNSKKCTLEIALPTRKNELWATDIVLCDNRQRTRILVVLDVFTRLPVILTTLDSGAAIAGQLVTHLNELSRGLLPHTLWVDRNLFKSEELNEWSAQQAINILCGAPVEQRSIFWKLLQRLSIFLTENAPLEPGDLKQKLTDWRQLYTVAAKQFS